MDKIGNMSTSTAPRQWPKAKPANEIEARMLLVLGCKAGAVSAITSIEPQEAIHLSNTVGAYGTKPTVCTVAAEMLGMDYHTVYRAMHNGDLRATRGTRLINQKQLRDYCRRYLNRDGAERGRYLLFAGVAPESVAFRAGVDRPTIRHMLRELRDAGIGPETTGPYSITQAARVLGIEPRLVRRYCQEGRLGRQVPDDTKAEYGITTKYVITRQDILVFGSKPRQVGKPGQVNRQRELANGKHHANGSRR